MGTFTPIEAPELAQFLRSYGDVKYESFRGIERGSVNSNFDLSTRGWEGFPAPRRVFLRLYEEQTREGAIRETALVARLSANGITTPAPLVARDGARVGLLAGKPAALFPFVDGEMSCQRGLDALRMEAVGALLARVHSASPEGLWPSRFGADELHRRLDRIAVDPRFGALAEPLRAKLTDAWARRRNDVPRGLIHGDVFRDNVLFRGVEITALLDFESASEGPFAYDLAVTLLAFGFDDTFVPTLVAALFRGYERVRPIEAAERRAIFDEARVAALRFTITRITDYAMREGAALVQKDFRRFQRRLEALDAMGAEGFEALCCGSRDARV